MLELPVAGAALIGRALLQAADAALLALGEDEAREAAARPGAGLSARWVLQLKQVPEPTAAALRASSSGLLAFAAVACALAVESGFARGAGTTPQRSLQLAAGILAGGLALVLDLAPRSLAAARPMAWALALAAPTRLVCALLWPPTRLLLRIFDALLLRRGATARFSPPPPPLEQIERILTEEARTGGPAAPSAELVHGLFAFGERTAKEIMVPRTEVVAVPLDAKPEEVIDLLAEEGHTRMPVFDGDLDHIKGVLHAKDIIPLLAHPHLIVLQDLLRPALFVPWTKQVGELLKEMQQNKSLLAVVVDEYGGFSGIVSLEDIIEEIVGDIRDGHDAAEPVLVFGPDGTATVGADKRIAELNEVLGGALPEGDTYETLGGLLNSVAGAIPQAGDRFFFNGLELAVIERDDRRVKTVRMSKQVLSQPPPPKATVVP